MYVCIYSDRNFFSQSLFPSCCEVPTSMSGSDPVTVCLAPHFLLPALTTHKSFLFAVPSLLLWKLLFPIIWHQANQEVI